MTDEQTTQPTAAAAPEAPAPESILTRAEALAHLEVLKVEALAKIAARDFKEAIADFLGALQRVPILRDLAPTDHGVHLIASNLADHQTATDLVNSVKVSEEVTP